MKSLTYVFLPLLLLGCKNGTSSGPDMAMATLGPPPTLAMSCSDHKADVYTLPALGAMDDSHRGDVFHCAVTESLTALKLNTVLQGYGYTGAPLPSGAWTWRIAFRTERLKPATGNAPEGDSAAVLLVPEKPLAGAPLVVFGHGSVGIAPKCAPSQLDLTMLPAKPDDEDFPINALAMVGYGFTVIMPDYAGFSYSQPPGYFVAEDEAHALLDATRAAAKILPSPPSNVVIVGHSQGAHAALSAHSYAKSYGLSGTLVGVATFAPFWISMSAWGALTTDTAGFTTANDSSAILYAMEYFYSEGELRDGPGGGVAMYQPSKQAAVPGVLTGGECYDSAKLQMLGAKPTDFFDMNFVTNYGFKCAATPIGSDCTVAPAPIWLARAKATRPPIDPKGPPILLLAGGMDHYLTATRAPCVTNKLTADLMAPGATTQLTYAYDAMAGHNDVIRIDNNVDFVNQWIAARGGVAAEPAARPVWPTGMCQPPPNDL